MSQRSCNEWARRIAKQREAQWREDNAREEARSAYAPAPGCEHAQLIETTCDYWHPLTLDDEGRVDVCFGVRGRKFECASCHVRRWPRDEQRPTIARAPICTRPACDCFVDCPPEHFDAARLAAHD